MKKKLIKIAALVLWALQLAGEIALVAAVAGLEILPASYIVLIGAVMLLFWAGVGAALFLPGKEKLWRRITSMVLSILIAAGCCTGCLAVAKWHETIEAITSIPVTEHTVAVYVLSEKTAFSLEDTKNFTFGILEDYQTQQTNYALDSMEDELGCALTVRSFDAV